MPSIRWDHGLRLMARGKVGAEGERTDGDAVIRNAQTNRRAIVIMPNLYGIDPMPSRSLPAPQQVINDGERTALPIHWLMAKGFAKEATFRVRAE